ncbi:MAG: hypothetical protein IPN34_14620 [Planctomycetes bacterium]|nr:hypothetical protein [Planctomycetota bacterium]
MSYYSRAIAQDLGCSENEAARIEAIVRWEFPTLNGLSKSRLRREAKIAQQVLAELRAEAVDSVEARAKRMLDTTDEESLAYAQATRLGCSSGADKRLLTTTRRALGGNSMFCRPRGKPLAISSSRAHNTQYEIAL